MTSLKTYDTRLLGGVDGFILLKTYTRLIPYDFNGVIAHGGEYSIENGELVYTEIWHQTHLL